MTPEAQRKKLLIAYLCVFPRSLQSHRYFQSESRAKMFIKYMWERYGIRGKVVKVKEVKWAQRIATE